MNVAEKFSEIHEMAEDAKKGRFETALENNITIPKPNELSAYSLIIGLSSILSVGLFL